MPAPRYNARVAIESDFFLVVEATTDNDLFDMMAPTVRLGPFNIAYFKNRTIVRRVYNYARIGDTYYRGRKLDRPAGLGEFLGEALLPGKQLEVRARGNEDAIMLRYAGYSNALTSSVMSFRKDETTFGPGIRFGSDPVPFATAARPGRSWHWMDDGHMFAATFANPKTLFSRPVEGVSQVGQVFGTFRREASRSE